MNYITDYTETCATCNEKKLHSVFASARECNAYCSHCKTQIKLLPNPALKCRKVRCGAATYNVPELCFQPETIVLNYDKELNDVLKFIANNAIAMKDDLCELAAGYGYNDEDEDT